MKNSFRPLLNTLEAREVPAGFSMTLPNGSVAAGQFSTPVGVDPTQASQTLVLLDLSVTAGTATYLVQPGATADYANGVLVGVTATATGPADSIALAAGIVTVGGYVAPISYVPDALPVTPTTTPPIVPPIASNPPPTPPVVVPPTTPPVIPPVVPPVIRCSSR